MPCYPEESMALAKVKQKSSHRGVKVPKITFSQVLKKSVERDINGKGWCQTCHKYQTLTTKKMIHKLPAVLTLLAGMLNEDQRRLWATPGWLPEEIGVIISGDGQFYCYEGEDFKYQQQRGFHNMAVYSLTGLAVSIETGHSSKGSHLVAMTNGMF